MDRGLELHVDARQAGRRDWKGGSETKKGAERAEEPVLIRGKSQIRAPGQQPGRHAAPPAGHGRAGQAILSPMEVQRKTKCGKRGSQNMNFNT